MSVILPVSFGEALDKLTILELKLHFIKDEKKLINVRKEYDELYNILSTYIDKVRSAYNLLYNVNKRIWILQDEIRDNIKPVSDYEKVVEENDARCRIKNKINHCLSSQFYEEKGYKKKRVIFHIPFEAHDVLKCIGVVRYLSTVNDETIVCCENLEAFDLAKLTFQDDTSIVVVKENKFKRDEYKSCEEKFVKFKWCDNTSDEKYYEQFEIPQIDKVSVKDYLY